jgi:CheY-like chemotaxis protein
MESSAMVEPLTILIAEDEAMVRMVEAETLRDAGFEIREARDGASALEILKSDAKVDLLITDIKMPGMNGYQLVEAGTQLRPGLKVILITGYAQDPLPADLAHAGIKVIYKPFDIDVLPQLAKQVLKVGG